MARAFYDDPVMSWLLSNDNARTARLTRLFATIVRHQHLAGGGVEVARGAAGIGGAALWDPPDRWRESRRQQLAPDVLAALVEEVDNGGHELRQAAILEVQRARTVIDFAARRVNPPVYQLGEWVIPRGYSIIINIAQIHGDPDVFPQPDRFDPQRYIGSKPSPFAWIPFGGGTRRCVGAAFANMEMDVVLRTVLRHFTLETTTAAGERSHGRGVAFTPKDGGRVVMRRR